MEAHRDSAATEEPIATRADATERLSDGDSWGFRHRGCIGIAILIPVALISLLAESPPQATWEVLAMQALAWPTFFAGAALRFWSTLYIGGRKRDVLVSEGPYSSCRNPLYLGTFLLALSAGLFLHSITFCAGAAIMIVGYALITVPSEERFLTRAFTGTYRHYARSVPRFLPRVSLFHTPRHIEVDVNALHREASKAVGWLLIPFIAEIISALRHQTWWPHWFP